MLPTQHNRPRSDQPDRFAAAPAVPGPPKFPTHPSVAAGPVAPVGPVQIPAVPPIRAALLNILIAELRSPQLAVEAQEVAALLAEALQGVSLFHGAPPSA
jgi:hypothetical protein